MSKAKLIQMRFSCFLKAAESVMMGHIGPLAAFFMQMDPHARRCTCSIWCISTAVRISGRPISTY